MKILKCLFFQILLFSMLASCNSGRESKNKKEPGQKAETPLEPVIEKKDTVRLAPFNDIGSTRKALSEIGIGALGPWKDDMAGGYMSITNYFQFGRSSDQTGMPNNLAIYLESENEHFIRSLKLVLNINNSGEKKQAINKLNNVSISIFKKLGVQAPKGLSEAILSGKNFNSASDNFTTELSLDRSKIETWKLTILSK